MAETIISKRCSKCKKTKPISEFYKHSRMKDGFFNHCKSCRAKYQTEYRKTEKGKVANRKGCNKYRKTANSKVVQRAGKKRFKARHPNQIKAQQAVNNAITANRLPRPDTLQCHYCPAQAEQYHHHKGYAKKHWLDVVPTCCLCHNNFHLSSP